jgi:uncharacterized SAM-binding protein YcdF (DUF218 family)
MVSKIPPHRSLRFFSDLFLPKRTLKKTWGIWLGLFAGMSFTLIYSHLSVPAIQPKAIFVLGGHEERERWAAKLARQHPELQIWVSSGSPEGYVKGIFAKAGVMSDRLHLDYRAKDTVTNFTTLVDDLKAKGIKRVYLVTSANHMGRAYVIGEIVFGSRGIEIEPVIAPSHSPPEAWAKSIRDATRAIIWLISGNAGESFKNSR